MNPITHLFLSTDEEEFNKIFSCAVKVPMEGDSEESGDGVQGEDRPVVLWEKCIQQSIFVDLSEDESLHLSDLENSLALHLSQAESAASEASIHLSGKVLYFSICLQSVIMCLDFVTKHLCILCSLIGRECSAVSAG